MNKTLPIYQFKGEILQKIQENDVIVITAETGAGKSTQVPQYLLEAGYKVVVTQPRRLAARTLAERVAEENAAFENEKNNLVKSTRSRLGETIGYRTAYEKMDSADTRVLFCTDGLQVVREILGQGKTDVLIIDEVHEWNLNVETLIAWTRKQLEEGKKTKVVLMSATLDAANLAKFYGANVPVISVPGRLFPVEESQRNPVYLIDEIKSLVSQGRNVLVFQPGKKEIEQTIAALKDIPAMVLPLHGELEPAEQNKCFRSYPMPKVVVATNVAQTSITIEDIDAVVDTGLERRVELADNIEGLYLKPISQADCKQRAGRSGRCREGKYILASNEDKNSRPEFPKAEIERVRLDQLVLRLAAAGFDATQLKFFHQPDSAILAEAKRALHALGAMTADGQLTKIGRLMSKLPLSVQYSRMLVEAEKKGVTEEVLTLVAILEVGGLRDRTDAWESYTTEQESDILAELDLWNAAKGKKNDELRAMGIFTKSYWRVKELRQKLSEEIRKFSQSKKPQGHAASREEILKACVAGMVDHLYQKEGYYGCIYRNGDNNSRELARESVVRRLNQTPEWIVGLPKTIQTSNKRGRPITFDLISMATKVDPAWLSDVAPQLAQKQRRNVRWDNERQCLMEDLYTVFNGMDIGTEKVIAEPSEASLRCLAEQMAYGYMRDDFNSHFHAANKQIINDTEKLHLRSAGEVHEVSQKTLIEFYFEKIKDARAVSREELEKAIKEGHLRPETLKLIPIPEEMADAISRANPERIEINGQSYEVKYDKKTNYSSGKTEFTAVVTISAAEVTALSADAIHLPSGRPVTIRVADEGYTDLFNTDIRSLKVIIEARRQDLVWKEFKKTHEMRKIDFVPFQPLANLPEQEIWDEKTGAVTHPAHYFSYNTFYIGYYRTEEEATKSQQNAEANKTALDAEADKETRLNELAAEAKFLWGALSQKWEPLKNDPEITQYCNESGTINFAFQRIQSLLSVSANRWGKPVCEKADEALKELEELAIKVEKAQSNQSAREEEKRVKEEAARLEEERLKKLEEAGEILRNFGGHFRRMGNSGNGDYWVIRADGTQREPDAVEYRGRYTSEGSKKWNLVDAEDLALSWDCGSMGDVNGSSRFTVSKQPKTLTIRQMESVAHIETENIGAMEGAFGLNQELQKKRQAITNEIVRTLNGKSYMNGPADFNASHFTALFSGNGVTVSADKLLDRLDWDKPFDTFCENREAQIVRKETLSCGVLEFMVYDKYGGLNVNVRFREFTEEEKQARQAVKPAEVKKTGASQFIHQEGRHFQCTCGCMERMTKEEYTDYKKGNPVALTCTGCQTTGMVQKEKTEDQPAEQPKQENFENKLAALQGKWGRK